GPAGRSAPLRARARGVVAIPDRRGLARLSESAGKMIKAVRNHPEVGTMGAAVMRSNQLRVDEIPLAQPAPADALDEAPACRTCGSARHALKHAEKLVEAAQRSGGPFVMDLKRDIVMGHEFCAEVVDYGPQTTRRIKTGARVCAMPVLIRSTGVDTVGYSNEHPGGYGEYMRLTEKLLLEVPNGLATERAALTD